VQVVDGFVELGTLKQVEFLPALRRASVVVRRFQHAGAEVHVKGAPEVLCDLGQPQPSRAARTRVHLPAGASPAGL
jgi:magnesium-transporting ATPase (P-type)